MRRIAPRDGQEGAAYVEFLIAFIPLFIMFLGMVQMSLMYAGDLVVQHAASRAARAAVVVIDDDPARYEGAPRRAVQPEGTSSGGSGLGGLIGVIGGGGGGGGNVGGPRLAAIRSAASMPLSAISPSMDQLVDPDSVRTAIGSAETRAATGVFLYNDTAMGVTFPTAPGAESYRQRFGLDTQVTTRVTYLFHCGVPVAANIMCETYPTLRLGPAAGTAAAIIGAVGSGSMTWEEARERLRRIDESRRRSGRDQPGIGELASSGASDLLFATWGTGARFKLMRGEATMPLQSARYEYR